MKFKKILFATIFCSVIYFLPGNIFSGDIEKANKYYEKYDYKYAIEIYEKIMQKEPSLEVAEKLANCYRFTNNSEQAEKAYAAVLTFSGFDPINYKYYADALKQNEKFDLAKQNYLLYAQRVPAQKELAKKLANSCEVARMWYENPDQNVQLTNEVSLNTEYAEFCPVEANDTLFFISDRWFVDGNDNNKKNVVYGWTGNPYLKIFQKDLKSSKVEILPKEINAEYHNGPVAFSSKGDTIYFTRADLPKKDRNKDITVGMKTIWYAVKNGDKWEKPQNLFSNTEYSVQHPALSPDGSILYFASDKPGGFGGMDLYAAKKQADGSWGEVINCGRTINSADDDVFPYVRSDNRFYYASKGHVGMGGLDIFSAEGSYNSFTKVENLKAPMNSPKDDFGICFENNDITSGYLSSDRNGGKGMDDIYRFSVVPVQPIYAINGEALDKKTGAPLTNINIILRNKTTGNEVSVLSDAFGKFHFELEPDMEYVVSGDRSKYYSGQEGEISTKDISQSTIFNVRFELEHSSTDAYLVKLNNIYYDFNKWNIRPDAEFELNKVYNFLTTIEDVNIELRAHTDSRGSDAYNKVLSQKRAESAVQYLQRKGIESRRLTAVGLGESQLLNQCGNGVKCSKEDHQLNRRTEFKVIKITPSLAMK